MYIILFLVLVALDQYTKYLAYTYLYNNPSINIIDNWLKLTYVENSGAAWGMFQNATIFFVIITIIIVFGILYYLLTERNNIDNFIKLNLVIILSGAIGNFIDRLRLGYVIDFISSDLGGIYSFPVFNFADMYISIGAFSLIIYILFFEGKNVTK